MTIAQQLKVKEFPFIINDSNGREIYRENESGDFWKYEYNSNGKKVYFELSSGNWWKYGYDTNGNEIYYENSDGFWYKKEYDSSDNKIYFENSDGTIIDNRPKLKTYRIPFVWECWKSYSVEATNLQEATELALKIFLTEPDDNFLDDSYSIDKIVYEEYPNEKLNFQEVVNKVTG